MTTINTALSKEERKEMGQVLLLLQTHHRLHYAGLQEAINRCLALRRKWLGRMDTMADYLKFEKEFNDRVVNWSPTKTDTHGWDSALRAKTTTEISHLPAFLHRLATGTTVRTVAIKRLWLPHHRPAFLTTPTTLHPGAMWLGKPQAAALPPPGVNKDAPTLGDWVAAIRKQQKLRCHQQDALFNFLLLHATCANSDLAVVLHGSSKDPRKQAARQAAFFRYREAIRVTLEETARSLDIWTEIETMPTSHRRDLAHLARVE